MHIINRRRTEIEVSATLFLAPLFGLGVDTDSGTGLH